MVFGQVPRPLASIRSDDHEWEQMTTRDRHALQTLAREAAELATAKNRLHEINRRASPTDLAPYLPGELCYVFREKVGSRDDKPGLPALLSSSGVTEPRAGYCPDNNRDRSQRLMSNSPQRPRNFHARMQLHLV
jgi:hypothetical protein